MHTFENVEAADAQSAECLRLMAYGRKVQELLSQSDAVTWIDHLWDMYTGLAHFTTDAGYDPEGHNKFVSLKELVFFFQEVDRMKHSMA